MRLAARFLCTPAAICLALSVFGVTSAQEKAPESRPAQRQQPNSVPITAAATGAGVRFAAVGAVERMRLEVFDASGQPVFDTGFRPGNVSDWRLLSTHGQPVPDATYLCVVTIRELSGRMSFKQGSVLVQSGQAALALDGGGEPEGVTTERVTPDEALSARSAEPSAMTVVAHDGEAGQVVSTTGPLTFRTGDVFIGKDREQMRLTEDGKLGIGTNNPQATLDVAGTIRASKGISFPDGTVLTSAAPSKSRTASGAETDGPTPTVSGTGTTGKLVKWTNGATGALGDSVVTESPAGNIGIGIAAPANKLHVVGAIEVGAPAGTGVDPIIRKLGSPAGFSSLAVYPASGTNVSTSFSVVPKAGGAANNRAQLAVFNTDAVANTSVYEFAALRARGADFVLGTGQGGGGINRPLMLAAGLLTNNTTNANQLVLATDGNVGIGMNNPSSKLDVTGSINTSSTYRMFGQVVLSTPGAQNTFVGIGAGANSDAFENSFFGSAAGLKNMSGNYNSFFGASAGITNTTGSSNSFFGRDAGASNTTGGQNSFFGASAGHSNMTGAGNAFFGEEAGRANTFGAYNTSLGLAAGSKNTTGGSNVFLGRAAGLSNTTEVGNIFLGAFAEGAPGISRATAIGIHAQVTQSNSLVLGGINGVNGSVVDTNVGIGTTAPAARFHVVRNTSAVNSPVAIFQSSGTQTPLAFRSGATETARIRADNVGNLLFATLAGSERNIHFRAGADSGTDMFIQSSTGNVGVGTTTPGAARLKVQGGDVFVAAPNSLVITSPNGACWQIRVTDAGALFAASVTCP